MQTPPHASVGGFKVDMTLRFSCWRGIETWIKAEAFAGALAAGPAVRVRTSVGGRCQWLAGFVCFCACVLRECGLSI